MAPREHDNKPTEGEPGETPVAAEREREWERVWAQDETDAEAGTGPEHEANSQAAEVSSEAEAETEAETEAGEAEASSEAKADSGHVKASSEAEADTGEAEASPEAKANSAHVKASSKADSGEAEVDSEGDEASSGAGANSKVEADSEATTDSDAEADPEIEPEAGPTEAAAPSPGHDHPHPHPHPHPHSHDHDHPHAHDHDHDHGHPHAHDHDDHAPHPGTPDDVAAEERVAAVRRLGAAGRRWRVVQLAGCAALLAVAMTAGAIAIGAAKDSGATGVTNVSSAVSPDLLASGSLDASIAALQAHLRGQPKDFDGWATLGLAYVEQARTKGDPSRYPQAQAAFTRSLNISPDNENALEGRAALAAARHEFAEALTYADKVLKENPYSERALCSRIDALVELGRYDEASKAADLADARKPGVPVFTRYAYVHELRGDVKTARTVLEQALGAATSPGDISYVAGTLGQLAWNQGDYKTALDYYGRALAADENYLPALEGRARAQAALGDRADAIKGLELVVSRYPLPQPLVELGELYESRGAAGDKAKADDQYALVDAWIALARANGVNADLDTALAAADHGDIKSALKAARAEWARRHTVHTADALAWALHVNGRDAEALQYARQATATGYHNASFIYHLGMIELATGHKADGRAHLAKALKLNPGFSPLGASKARKALEATK
ncbi:Tetratricopeptide repeat-containing protein [Streptomyces sp. 3213]|uniref:tetratricopeptide repeat protein n=1 Tax=Streptomyces sp. 3213.3 TaxID=1855348 RepID=UPI00089B0C76|nr:tetratricopeptide repeat protein [Streptomyces sp. 3213.3]SED09862.1 Tetratricopeptide repeat-containing protein [Streptomyces sp. 3213] [Streptomyces sp. 3213.3]